jgi:hypothetical protein
LNAIGPTPVTFSFIVPDLVDKPLWVLGVFTDGRNISHYPFKTYDFPNVDWHGVLTLPKLASTLLQMAVAAIVVSVAVLLILTLSSWVRGRRTPRATGASQSGGSADKKQ